MSVFSATQCSYKITKNHFGIAWRAKSAVIITLICWWYSFNPALMAVNGRHLVLVISCFVWLLLDKRSKLIRTTPSVSFLAVGVFLICGIGWLLASIKELTIAQNIFALLMLPTVIVASYGLRFSKIILFPLSLLLLLMPVDALVVPVWNNIVTNFLQLVLGSGEYNITFNKHIISLICFSSFITYLAVGGIFLRVVIFLLGVLFPYSIYILSLYVGEFFDHQPVIVQYINEWLGHTSLILGILSFLVVAIALHKRYAPPNIPTGIDWQSDVLRARNSWLAVTILLTAMMLFIPGAAKSYKQKLHYGSVSSNIIFPKKVLNWRGPETVLASEKMKITFAKDNNTNELVRYYNELGTIYLYACQAMELGKFILNGSNEHIQASKIVKLQLQDQNNLDMLETVLVNEQGSLLSWHLYHACGLTTSSKTIAKILSILNMIAHGNKEPGIIAVLTPIDHDLNKAREKLSNFMYKIHPQLDVTLLAPTAG